MKCHPERRPRVGFRPAFCAGRGAQSKDLAFFLALHRTGKHLETPSPG